MDRRLIFRPFRGDQTIVRISWIDGVTSSAQALEADVGGGSP